MADAQIEIIRNLLASAPRPAGLAERRERLVSLFGGYPLPSDVYVEAVDANGVRAEWTSTPAADPTRVVLFLHGGAYIAGGLATHRHMVAQAGREARTQTLALDYRLAPEHPFPAAVDDAIAGYEFLLTHGYEPANIALAGESAGGSLALATLVSLRDMGIGLPACLWLSSPWVDLEMTGETMVSKSAVDPLIQKAYLQEAAAAYLNGADPRSPLASPLYANLRELPPMLIQVGTAETLLDDALRVARRAAEADVRVTLEAWPDMIHAWSLFYQQLDDGQRSLASMGAFVHAMLNPDPEAA
ncbi:alpha/beta hydrolase [Paraburkholderia sp. LEh10]|uniref:alpha/beta hydrolase n=1 Tax=Paraburkholderia sp. LEh10 TaxID=2821353 RepID=UPI001AE9099D|nr:alpha/beta hydrolase [Paraburkholderia sp. LEh10]MBP0590331.1 alpha/beta hydrolase [Paraburkholderia sp. LEh10]